MKQKTTKKTIIWAIDPMDPHARPEQAALDTLKKMAWIEGVRILPVYVLSSSDVETPVPLRETGREISAARKASESFLSGLGVDWAERPVVLVENSPNASKAAERLSRYAVREGAEFIALSTNGRKGAQRFFLGSFAELLLARAQVPVFFISHGSHAQAPHLGKALFPTDFSEYSKAAFELFLKHAKVFGTEVIVFHQAPFSPRIEAMMLSSGSMGQLPQNFWEEQETWAKEEATKWTRRASELGVRARALVSSEHGDPSDQILNAAKSEGVGMIAMASQSGPFTSFLFGSVARGVFRPHEIPVWVCGPTFLRTVVPKDEAKNKNVSDARMGA